MSGDEKTRRRLTDFVKAEAADKGFDLCRITRPDAIPQAPARLADFLSARGADASPERCRRLAIAINGLLDGLWLEGCLAGELFGESELVEIALTSIETLLGLPLRRADAAPVP